MAYSVCERRIIALYLTLLEYGINAEEEKDREKLENLKNRVADKKEQELSSLRKGRAGISVAGAFIVSAITCLMSELISRYMAEYNPASVIVAVCVLAVLIALCIVLAPCALYHPSSLVTDHFIGLYMYDEIIGVLDDILLFDKGSGMNDIIKKAKEEKAKEIDGQSE